MNGTITDHKMAQIISAEPRGVGIEMLMQSLGEEASRRTMQRRLEEFMRLGWIERHGKARATKYHVTETGRATLLRGEPGRLEPSMLREDPPPMPTPQRELVLPKLGQSAGPELGEESKHLRDIIRQPQALRKVCGYRREFLDTYQPDKTAYLPETLRKHLHGIGQSEHMAAMSAGTYARHVLDRLIIDLSWNSSRLEGSTYSLLETDHLLALGKSDDPVRFLEMQMILNHKAAIEFLVESPDELGFNRYTFLNLHAILSEGLLKNANSEVPCGPFLLALVGRFIIRPTSLRWLRNALI